MPVIANAADADAWSRKMDAGLALDRQGRYREARAAWEEARQIAEISPQPDGRLATVLNDLATVHLQLHDTAAAERYARRSAAIWEQLGEIPYALAPRANLAGVYLQRHQYTSAEKLLLETLELSTRRLGPQHLLTANILANLSQVAFDRRDWESAAGLSARVVDILRKIRPADDPDIALAAGNLGAVYQAQGRLKEASDAFFEAIDVLEKHHDPEHPAWIKALDDYAAVEAGRGNYGQADTLLKRALAVAEKRLGPEHPWIVRLLRDDAVVSRHIGRKAEARELLARAERIQRDAMRKDGSVYTVDIRNLR